MNGNLNAAYWRKTPLAVFPALLGFSGFALVYQNAAGILPIPEPIGDVLAGMSFATFAFFALSYFAKIVFRPGVLREDINSPPARAGLAAIPMTMMVTAATLVEMGAFAVAFWFAGLTLQFLVAATVMREMRRAGTEKHSMSTFLLLPFVGFIVAPVGGVALGFAALSELIAWASLVPFSYVIFCNLRRLITVRPPPPMRMSLVIFLGPISLFGIAFAQLGPKPMFIIFAALSVLVIVSLLAVAGWLMHGGWTPVWASITFPLAAFTNLQLLVVQSTGKDAAIVVATLAILLATIAIPYAVYMSLRAWVRGDLSRMTSAAIA